MSKAYQRDGLYRMSYCVTLRLSGVQKWTTGCRRFGKRRANVSPSLSDQAYHHLDISDMENLFLNRHIFGQ